MKILVTGAAGFIGSHLVDKLLEQGYKVTGLDDFNDYYDPKIKENNIKQALKNKDFKLYREDILSFNKLKKIFEKENIDKVVHLAARAGVRPSFKLPLLYSQVNVLGTVNLLKLSAEFNVRQFIFGSSSSVYGKSDHLPFIESDECSRIISPYGASKRAAEFWVQGFNKSHKLRSVILRFFTVYGPRGRPDMATALFTNAIFYDRIINHFGDGTSSRDYTYVDDVIDGILKCIENNIGHGIINLGNNHPITLAIFTKSLENVIGKKAKIKKFPAQPGDVEKTWAHVGKAKELLNWQPKTLLMSGLENYIKWRKFT